MHIASATSTLAIFNVRGTQSTNNVVLTAHTPKTSVASEIAEQRVIFQFSCQRGGFLGSSAVEHFGGEGSQRLGKPGGLSVCRPRSLRLDTI